MGRGFPSVALVLLIAGVWLLGSPADALAQKQRSALKGPDDDFDCGGPSVGKAIIKDLDNGDTKVKVKVTNGPKRHSFDVYWLCTTDSFGCHASSCGDVYLGSFTTDADGKGKLKKILPGGNPFPGNFVHLDVVDLTGGAWFAATFGAIPALAGGPVTGAAVGDPE
jgi:hypothetical protein